MTRQSPILHVIARFALPFSLLVAARIFLQGHDEPGGGFIAGVLLAAAGAIYMLAFGVQRARQVAWWRLAVVGLGISVLRATRKSRLVSRVQTARNEVAPSRAHCHRSVRANR
jgi:multisubunit Na+/H+ antiporter MnhB subunit